MGHAALYGVVGLYSPFPNAGVGVTRVNPTSPSAEWIARQLTEAYARTQAPQYIIRDRDGIYGDLLIRRLRAMGIRDRPIAPRSPGKTHIFGGSSARSDGSALIMSWCSASSTSASCWDRTKDITMTRARTYR